MRLKEPSHARIYFQDRRKPDKSDADLMGSSGDWHTHSPSPLGVRTKLGAGLQVEELHAAAVNRDFELVRIGETHAPIAFPLYSTKQIDSDFIFARSLEVIG